jgi:hypothetical protein
VEAAGSVLASLPPQEMRRNGAPRASSPIDYIGNFAYGVH